jgi:predicted nucleic acid-binding protein
VPGLVIADTGPLRYLVLIGHVEALPRLFGAVSIPATVADELLQPTSPEAVRAWIADPPSWLTTHPDPSEPTAQLTRLDPGERAAIALAQALGAGLLLVDDRAGVAAARQRGFRVTGTLGVLADAAREGLLNLASAFAALRGTNFFAPAALFDALLDQHRRRIPREGSP